MNTRITGGAGGIAGNDYSPGGNFPLVERLLRARLQALLEPFDVRLDGHRRWDVTVLDPRFYGAVFARGGLGAGESYMAGWWDCDRLDELMTRVWHCDLPKGLASWYSLALALRSRLLNLQTAPRAWEVGKHHYDIGNELFRAMLDRRMIYSCGYWAQAKTLDAAQEAKLDLIARKLGFRSGMRVLDVGCGWGGALAYFAGRYGIKGVGITVSSEQARLAGENCRGLPVEVRLQDYRDLDEPFERIYSVGMFEHVGVKNYRGFFETLRRCLRQGGLFLLHTIGAERSQLQTNPWLSKYIFPNSMLPSMRQIATATEGLWTMEDWHNFGADYDRTLMAWHRNWTQAWPALRHRYDETFRRMWDFYLLSCAGYFRSRAGQLWQVVFSPDGVTGGYRPEGIR